MSKSTRHFPKKAKTNVKLSIFSCQYLEYYLCRILITHLFKGGSIMNALAYESNIRMNNVTFRMEVRNIQELLLNMGFPQHVYGYDYVIYSLELISQNPGILPMSLT